MRDRIRRFMMGRYGNDQLNQFLVVIAVLMLLLNLILHISVFYFIALALILLMYFRMFSKNLNARNAENMKYLDMKDAITGFFTRGKSGGGGSDYHIYRCPDCGQKIRIPRGKGKIRITCPKCGSQFVKRS